MKKQYWTIIQPDGKVWAKIYFESIAKASGFISFWKNVPRAELKKEGWKVVKCWVEIEERP